MKISLSQLTTHSIILALATSSFAQGLLGKSAADMQDEVAAGDEDIQLLDTRSRLLRIPNLSQPACSLEIGRSFNTDTKSQGLQVITRFKLNTEVVGVVAQVGKDETAKIDSKTKKLSSLFENKKYIYLAHFFIDEMTGLDQDRYQYLAFEPKFGNVPGLALRPRDRKFILATQKSDLDRANVETNTHIKVERFSFEDYRKILYPRFRQIELDAFQKRDLPVIEEGIKNLEKVDKEFRELFKEKIKAFEQEQKACDKIVKAQS